VGVINRRLHRRPRDAMSAVASRSSADSLKRSRQSANSCSGLPVSCRCFTAFLECVLKKFLFALFRVAAICSTFLDFACCLFCYEPAAAWVCPVRSGSDVHRQKKRERRSPPKTQIEKDNTPSLCLQEFDQPTRDDHAALRCPVVFIIRSDTGLQPSAHQKEATTCTLNDA